MNATRKEFLSPDPSTRISNRFLVVIDLNICCTNKLFEQLSYKYSNIGRHLNTNGCLMNIYTF